MIIGLLPKLGIGVLGLGTAVASGYGVYELARTKTIFEILSREYKVLKTGQNDDKADWKKVVAKYKTATDNEDPKKIKDFSPKTGTEITEEDLKSKCSDLLKKSYVSDKDLDYKNALEWCTTKNATEN